MFKSDNLLDCVEALQLGHDIDYLGPYVAAFLEIVDTINKRNKEFKDALNRPQLKLKKFNHAVVIYMS